ncbi:MAG: tetratricopeptide repeat protein, partial [Gemmatimonadetes bacterium]|nr:tetratricopeptide repeat protein [Gemmatimonadota bacterium]
LTGDTPPPMYYAFAVLAAAISGNMEEAVSLGREGLEEHPGDPSILVNTGVVLDREGEHEAAEAYFLRAVQSGSTPPPQAHKNLGDQAFRRGDIMGAQAHFERAVKLDPNLGEDVYVKLGQIAYDDADKDLALLLWRKALDINPDDERVRENLDMLSAAP